MWSDDFAWSYGDLVAEKEEKMLEEEMPWYLDLSRKNTATGQQGDRPVGARPVPKFGMLNSLVDEDGNPYPDDDYNFDEYDI